MPAAAVGEAANSAAVGVPDGGEAAADVAGEQLDSAATSAAVDSWDRGGSLVTAPGELAGRDPRPAAGCRSHIEIYVLKARHHDSQPR